MQKTLYLCLLLFISCLSCKEHKSKPVKTKKIKKEVVISQEEMKTLLAEHIQSAQVDSLYKEHLTKSLEIGSYTPIANNLNQLKQLENALIHRKKHGLSKLFRKELLQIQTMIQQRETKAVTKKQILNDELKARKISYHYAKALQYGVLDAEKTMTERYDVKQIKADSTWFANQLTITNYGNHLEQFKVKHPFYSQLQKAYLEFQKDTTEWQKIRSVKRPIKKNKTYLDAQLLRKRFKLPLIADSLQKKKHTYDSLLVEKVKEFQLNHGLADDGVLGNGTISVLNLSKKDILTLTEANLDKLRWQNGLNYDNLLLVNIPEYTLHVYENQKEVLTKKVCVGLAGKDFRTPEFINKVKYVVVNPKWRVPHSIAYKETIPKAKEDPNFLEKNNYTILDRDGNEVPFFSLDFEQISEDDSPYRFIQNVGGGNALGRVKILFPNKHLVYLHDTPSKKFFKRNYRAVSHGCVRLEKPFELTDFLMQGNAEYLTYKETDENQWMNAEKDYPIFITYITTFGKNGQLHYVYDVYKRDKNLVKAWKKVTSNEIS